MPRVPDDYVKKEFMGVTITKKLHTKLYELADAEENGNISRFVEKLLMKGIEEYRTKTPSLLARKKLIRKL